MVEAGVQGDRDFVVFSDTNLLDARMPILYSTENDKAIPKNPTRISRYGFYYRLRFNRTDSDDGTN